MTVRASEVAIGQKDNGTDMSRPIQEGGFDEALDRRMHDAGCQMFDQGVLWYCSTEPMNLEILAPN